MEGVLDSSERSALRRAVGGETLATLTEAVSRVGVLREPTIPVSDIVALEDLRLEWIWAPALAVIEAARALAARDVTAQKPKKVRQDFRELARLVADTTELAEFIAFFDSELVKQTLRQTYVNVVLASTELVTSLTATDDDESAQALNAWTNAQDRLDEDELVLRGLRYAQADDLSIDDLSGEEHFAQLFGLSSERFTSGYGDWAQRLRASSIDPRPIVEAQLAYLDLPDHNTPLADVYVNFAFRVPLSGFPLLAHRLMLLTLRLSYATANVNAEKVQRLVLEFFRNETPWIIATGPRYEEVMQAYLNGDRPAILDGYRRLCEGILRPYASLLCALEETRRGTPPAQLTVEPTLGAMEQRLRRCKSDSACALLVSFLRRDLRNADAHARAAVAGSGDLVVRLIDGSHETVIPNHIWAATQALRSALDGIDSASNIFFAEAVAPSAKPEDYPKLISEPMVAEFARRAAHEYTEGTVSEVRIEGGQLTATFVGAASDDQLYLMLMHLASAAHDAFSELIVVTEHGDELYTLTRNPP